MQFEHRDLHWGNILLEPIDKPFVTFKLSGRTIEVPANGVKVTIIDYTLSRMLYNRRVCFNLSLNPPPLSKLTVCIVLRCPWQTLYNDLSKDKELFVATGDYQFDIYRLMRKCLDDEWTRFNPKTNVLWVHYVVDKLVCGVRYQSSKTRNHCNAIDKLMAIRDTVVDYQSAASLVDVFF